MIEFSLVSGNTCLYSFSFCKLFDNDQICNCNHNRIGGDTLEQKWKHYYDLKVQKIEVLESEILNLTAIIKQKETKIKQLKSKINNKK